MRALCSWLGFLGTLALAGLPASAGAQAVGSEFQINTTTFSQQFEPSVAADAVGNFVVVWNSLYQDGMDGGIFGQRYDSAGVPLGSEFRVNSAGFGHQFAPSVASDTSGNFVVVWASEGVGFAYDIFGQRYDSVGVAQGSEFRVNSYPTGYQAQPSVASAASGNFVVVWRGSGQDDSDGVFGQRYDSGGVALGNEFRVNSYTTGEFQFLAPSVASDASGNFVVVWHNGSNQDGSSFGVFGQRYDSAGVAQGDEFRVNSYTTGGQYFPSVASDASGNFVVVWDGAGEGNGGVFGQRYDSGGGTLGSEFRVTTGGRGAYVAADASGNFVVAWNDLSGQDGSGYGVFGQRYDNAGVPQGSEFQINSFTTGNQVRPSVGATGTNQFVVAWDSFGQDGPSLGVFGQRFDFTPSVTVASPNTNVRWRIGSLQRIKWTHNLGLNSTFRIELDRTDDGTYEELIAAAAPSGSATRGSFAWSVTGPPSANARVRVSWTDDPSVSDASDTTFQIVPAALDGSREE